MSCSKHHKLRLLQSTGLNLSAKASNTRKSLLSATPIPTLILSVRFPKTVLPEITLPQILTDRLPHHTVVQEREARVARHNLSTMALVAIEVIGEAVTTIGVEA